MTIFHIPMSEEQADWIEYKLNLEIALYVRLKADRALDQDGEHKLDMMLELKAGLGSRFNKPATLL